MPHSADCPCGRSQILSPAQQGDKIAVDRSTLERILSSLNGCSVNVQYLSSNHIFVEAAESYLATQSNLESLKAQKLLSIWIQTWPDAGEELTDCLDEALQLVEFILAASAGGGNG
jgi:hypothetical protein